MDATSSSPHATTTQHICTTYKVVYVPSLEVTSGTVMRLYCIDCGQPPQSLRVG
jgi:hypothetical protein